MPTCIRSPTENSIRHGPPTCVALRDVLHKRNNSAIAVSFAGYRGRYIGNMRAVCKPNMSIAIEKRRIHKLGLLIKGYNFWAFLKGL